MARLLRSVCLLTHMRAIVYRSNLRSFDTAGVKKSVGTSTVNEAIKSEISAKHRRSETKAVTGDATARKSASTVSDSTLRAVEPSPIPETRACAKPINAEFLHSTSQNPITNESESDTTVLEGTSTRKLRQYPIFSRKSQKDFKDVNPGLLQRRIRRLLAYIVMDSVEPQTLNQVLEILARDDTHELDKPTYEMADYASRGVELYEQESLSVKMTKKAIRDDREEKNAMQIQSHCPPCTLNENAAALWHVGKVFHMLHHTSLFRLLSLKEELSSESRQAHEEEQQTHLFASQDVMHWMAYAILLSDPHFRVSMYSGYVCYPTLPSLLMATWDLYGSPLHRAAKPYLWRKSTPQGVSPYLYNIDEDIADANKDKNRKKYEEKDKFADLLKTGLKENCTLYDKNMALSSHTRSAAAVCGTLVFGLTAAIEGVFVDGSNGVRSDRCPIYSKKLQNWSASCTTTQAKRWDSSVSTQGCTATSLFENTAHPLVSLWLNFLETENSTANALPSQYSNVLEPDAQETASGDKASSRTFSNIAKQQSLASSAIGRVVGTGWNEAQTGCLALRRWLSDATDGASMVAYCMQPIFHAFGGVSHVNALCGVNREVLHDLFLRMLATAPISVTRLATLLRWNVSLPFAAHYGNCFLYFLLLYTANPTLRCVQISRNKQRHHHQGHSPLRPQRCCPLLPPQPALGLRYEKNTALDCVRVDFTPPTSLQGTTSSLLSKPGSVAFRSHNPKAQAARPSCGVAVAPATIPKLPGTRSEGSDPVKAISEPIEKHVPAPMSSNLLNSSSLSPSGSTPFQLIFFRCKHTRSIESVGSGSPRKEVNDNNKTYTSQTSEYVINLRHVEYLDTDVFMPREVIQHLLNGRRYDAESQAEGSGRLPEQWEYLNDLSESLLCFPVSVTILEMRLKPLVKHWTHLEDQRRFQSHNTRLGDVMKSGSTVGHLSQGSIEAVPLVGNSILPKKKDSMAILLPVLCRMCLWEHEYGVDIACEMMFLYLRRFSQDKVHVVSRSAWDRMCGVRTTSNTMELTTDVKNLVAVFPS